MIPLHITEIDTIVMKIDFINDSIQRKRLAELLDYIRTVLNHFIDPVEYDIGFDKRIEYKVYCNNRTVVSFKTGYSNKNYYIIIKFAGLKSYDAVVDSMSLDYLLVIAAYLKTKTIIWQIIELDLALDVFHVNFENLLPICTSHTSRTQYHSLDEIQLYHNETRWIEKFETGVSMNNAVKRAYLYHKTLKEQTVHNNILGNTIQRFEVKLQSGHFHKHGFNIEALASSLNMYHLLYFSRISDKYALIAKYNSYQSVRKREIERMNFKEYRLHFDFEYINNFISMLLDIDDRDIFGDLTY